MAYIFSERENRYFHELRYGLAEAKMAINLGDEERYEEALFDLEWTLNYMDRLEGLERVKATDMYREAREFVKL